jgi:flagellar hook assembly protein FlgD
MFRMTLMFADGVESDFYSGLPEKVTLAPNYPNPFNPSTTMRFGLPNSGYVRLEIFDVLGRRIKTLTDGCFEPGYHAVTWDGKTDKGDDVGSGVYYSRLSVDGNRATRKILLVR